MKFLNHNLFTGDITVNGTTTLSTATGITRPTGDNTTHLATTEFVKAQGYATTAALSGYVPITRTITINGTTLDLSADRAWTIASGDYTSKIQHTVKAGVAINKGQAVYVTTSDGTNMIVGLASNATEATSSKTMGLLDATVAQNGFANVVTEGLLAGLNTIGATAGDPVWLGTGGNLIYGLVNKPYAPAHLVFIGIVTRVNANNGEIFVKVQNGFELNEIHDIDLKTVVPVNGHILGFDGTLWVNKTIASWLGYTPANASGTTNYLSKFTGSTTLGNSIVYDNGTNVGIGTNSPGEKLTIIGDNAVFAAKSQTADASLPTKRIAEFAGIYNSGSNGHQMFISSTAELGPWEFNLTKTWGGILTLGVSTNGTERTRGITINSSGNVGIDTINPTQKLTVAGSINLLGSSAVFLDGTSAWGAPMLGRDGATIFLSDYSGVQLGGYNGSAYGPRMTVLGTGKVGIGTTNPTSTLQVNGLQTNTTNTSANDPYGTLRLDYAGGFNAGDYGSSVVFTQQWFNGSSSQVAVGTISGIKEAGDGNFGGGLAFWTSNGSSNYLAERIRITKDGNVGIGTTSPGYKLSVDSVSQSTIAKFYTSDNNYSTIEVGDTGDVYSSIYLASDSGNGQIYKYGAGWGTESGMLSLYSSNGPISLQAGGSTKVFVTAAGSVGIGTISPDSKLQITSSSSNIFRMVRSQNNFGFEATTTSSGGYGLYDYQASSYDIYFKAGTVGIGTTSPTNKLQVANGNMSITTGYSFILADTDTNWRLGRNIIAETGNQLTANTMQFVAANAANEGWQFVDDDGNTRFEIGASTGNAWLPSGNLYLNGNLAATQAWVTSQGYLTSYTETDTLATVVARGNSTSSHISVDYIITTNNGAGTNVRLGDDFWMGDINLANTARFMGNQNNSNAYIVFGNGDATALGRAGTGALTYGGNTVWHAGNDGAGSGLDADTLDGLHASSFLTAEADTLASVTARGSSTTGSIFINGLITGGLGAVTTSGTLDWNDVSNARSGSGYTLLLGTATNGMGGGQYYHPISFEYSSKNGGGNMTQLAIPYTGNGIWYRYRYSGSWGSWTRVWDSGDFTSTSVSNWNTAYGWGNHASQGYATQTYVNTAISNLVDAAPTTLDTLNELAAALGDDPNFATTVATSIGNKVAKAGDTMTGNLNWGATGLGLTWDMNTDGAYIKFFNTGNGDTDSRLEYATYDDGNEYHRWVISSVERMNLKAAGLTVTGNVTCTGTFTETSSRRFKENIVDLESTTEKVEKLRPVRYNKIDNEATEIGLIAEEVAELFPEVVTYNENGQPSGVQYQRLSVILLKTIQEQNVALAALTERINKLENK